MRLNDATTQQPDWLSQPALRAVLNHLIKQLNKQPAEQRVNHLYESTHSPRLKTLFEPAEPGDDEILWQALQMAIDDGVFTLKPGRHQPWEPEYKNARLQFVWAAEDRVRNWLDAPRLANDSPWAQALERADAALNRDFLARSPLMVQGHSADEVLAALALMRTGLLADHHLSLRQLAAIYLWGASKTLDSRGEAWLASALNIDPMQIQPRRVHVSVYSPQRHPVGFLFIENQDTFDILCQQKQTPHNMAVVYLSGFKATAGRVRESAFASLFFAGQTDIEDCSRLYAMWFDRPDVPAFVWTDLDYAGLNIAIALRRAFPSLNWFSPGYEAMVQQLTEGRGHPIDERSKGEQIPPDRQALWGAGEHYLSQIERYHGFVDQESVLFAEIMG